MNRPSLFHRLLSGGIPGVVLVLTLFGQMAWAQRGKTDLSIEGTSVDTMVATFMAEQNIPGLAVAVVQAPYITRIMGYGFSDSGRRLLSASNTMFQVGELSEGMTAIAILQLVEQGKVKLDDKIEQHVPLAPAAWHGVTVQQLLQHQSGLPDYTRAGGNPGNPAAELFKAVSETGPAFEPGTRAAPSATDYLLLQLVIENASGQSYESFVRANQFDKIGLKHTFFAGELSGLPRDLPSADDHHKRFLQDPAFINPSEPATGYIADNGKPDLVPVPADRPTFRGTVYSSAEDIGLWSLAVAGEIFVKNPDLRSLIYAPAKVKDGSTAKTSGPWLFPDHPGQIVSLGHGIGFSAVLNRYTDSKELLYVIILANKENTDLGPLAEQIAAACDASIKPAAIPLIEPAPTATPAPSPTPSPTPELPKPAPPTPPPPTPTPTPAPKT